MDKPITLQEYYEQTKPIAQQLYNLALQHTPSDGLILSALGARICYSNEHPMSLTQKDKRIYDSKERKEFLIRLANHKHFSVFAHSPIVLRGNLQQLLKLYKVFNYKDYYLLTARHFIELFSIHGFDINPIIEKWTNKVTMTGGDVLEAKYGESSVIFQYYPVMPFGWIVMITHRFSRAYTHQHVRHTWQNYSQRSHRYTEVDGHIMPPAVAEKLNENEELKLIYQNTAAATYEFYNTLLENDIRKEDARYFTFTGSATTLMSTGPVFVFEDFVQKRNHKKAQWEIRAIATALDTFLNEYVLQ